MRDGVSASVLDVDVTDENQSSEQRQQALVCNHLMQQVTFKLQLLLHDHDQVSNI